VSPELTESIQPPLASGVLYMLSKSILFWGVHLGALAGVVLLGWSWSGFALAVGLYFARMFFVVAGYHRYFSHRSFKTSRAFQFVLGFMGASAAQKGPLWWASNHRHHHKYSDTRDDLHSPVQRGFWWSHIGWILSPAYESTDLSRIPDLARYPELRWLNRNHLIPVVLFAAACLLLGGAHGFVWGFLLSTVLLWHGTFTINSLSHVFGRRRYLTSDDSRNNWLLALITLGEGWHNNHHHYQRSVAQGFRWYEIDLAYYILRGMSLVGLVWGLHRAPAHVIHGHAKARPARSGPEGAHRGQPGLAAAVPRDQRSAA
jgi:stearoyl-CoA desaturase (delta-9 desaturase)